MEEFARRRKKMSRHQARRSRDRQLTAELRPMRKAGAGPRFRYLFSVNTSHSSLQSLRGFRDENHHGQQRAICPRSQPRSSMLAGPYCCLKSPPDTAHFRARADLHRCVGQEPGRSRAVSALPLAHNYVGLNLGESISSRSSSTLAGLAAAPC
jgi:hypothetical protein